jgi:hypothetical protein
MSDPYAIFHTMVKEAIMSLSPSEVAQRGVDVVRSVQSQAAQSQIWQRAKAGAGKGHFGRLAGAGMLITGAPSATAAVSKNYHKIMGAS